MFCNVLQSPKLMMFLPVSFIVFINTVTSVLIAGEVVIFSHQYAFPSPFDSAYKSFSLKWRYGHSVQPKTLCAELLYFPLPCFSYDNLKSV